jgi:hypothetical protein
VIDANAKRWQAGFKGSKKRRLILKETGVVFGLLSKTVEQRRVRIFIVGLDAN